MSSPIWFTFTSSYLSHSSVKCRQTTVNLSVRKELQSSKEKLPGKTTLILQRIVYHSWGTYVFSFCFPAAGSEKKNEYISCAQKKHHAQHFQIPDASNLISLQIIKRDGVIRYCITLQALEITKKSARSCGELAFCHKCPVLLTVKKVITARTPGKSRDQYQSQLCGRRTALWEWTLRQLIKS